MLPKWQPRARQAAEAAGLDSETAREKAADIAVEKVTEKALADGDSIADSAAKAREAAEGAGLMLKRPKTVLPMLLPIKWRRKPLPMVNPLRKLEQRRSQPQKLLVFLMKGRRKRPVLVADIAADEAISKGLSEEEARDRAKAAAQAAGFNATDAEQIATGRRFTDAKDAYRPFEGNRTPVVQNVQAAQIEGTKLLRITYDLKVADDFPCNITIRWSTDNEKLRSP